MPNTPIGNDYPYLVRCPRCTSVNVSTTIIPPRHADQESQLRINCRNCGYSSRT